MTASPLLTATRPFIKICGLTDPDNTRETARAGADLIGLVFFEKSPRHLSLDKARAVGRAVPDRVIACGVFVDADMDYILERVAAANLKAVQLHGNEPPEMVKALSDRGLTVIKALFASKSPGLDQYRRYSAEFFLAECGRGKLPGGNAKTWDYGLVRQVDQPCILAGGLGPDNIAAAIAAADPAGVDLSSSVETAPGVKDIRKVTSVVDQVLACRR